ncbi:hypothetical protein ACPOL_4664 [Acidisarcina polymorpha]|uniref:Uncharacterized protein n=1 Tax=Acidisarcina polymorpha TaxID=2211140 RepID=A0A2Z5G523_9BACT|nr:hypothetical protein ACPOL_4664 [Acidisarcina polymorpha]
MFTAVLTPAGEGRFGLPTIQEGNYARVISRNDLIRLWETIGTQHRGEATGSRHRNPSIWNRLLAAPLGIGEVDS